MFLLLIINSLFPEPKKFGFQKARKETLIADVINFAGIYLNFLSLHKIILTIQDYNWSYNMPGNLFSSLHMHRSWDECISLTHYFLILFSGEHSCSNEHTGSFWQKFRVSLVRFHGLGKNGLPRRSRMLPATSKASLWSVVVAPGASWTRPTTSTTAPNNRHTTTACSPDICKWHVLLNHLPRLTDIGIIWWWFHV